MIKLIPFIYILCFAVFISSCSEGVMDAINTDPNNPTDASANLMLPQVIVESAYGTTGTDLAWYASVFCEQNAGVFAQMKDADYRIGVTNSSLVNNNWSSLYLNMFDLKTIIDKCSYTGVEKGNNTILGIARVLLAYNLGVAVDLWGDVPFKEAFKAQNNFQPAYDKAQDLYPEIQLLLDSAIVSLSKSSTVIPLTNDLIYKGNAKNWTKAAYSLKIRYLNRLSNIQNNDDLIISLLPHAFGGASDAFVFSKFENTTNGYNPWYSFYKSRNYIAVGQTLYDLMTSISIQDPRFDAYFGGAAGLVAPAPNGSALADQVGTRYSRAILAKQTAAIPLMSYHELKFIEAEVNLRKGNVINARFAFNDAVTSAFASLGIDGTAYLSKLPITLSLSDIYKQKYISLYESGSIEAYNEVRRTGIPQMNNPNNQVTSLGFVHHFPYASDEIATNRAHIPQSSPFQKLFWEK